MKKENINKTLRPGLYDPSEVIGEDPFHLFVVIEGQGKEPIMSFIKGFKTRERAQKYINNKRLSWGISRKADDYKSDNDSQYITAKEPFNLFVLIEGTGNSPVMIFIKGFKTREDAQEYTINKKPVWGISRKDD